MRNLILLLFATLYVSSFGDTDRVESEMSKLINGKRCEVGLNKASAVLSLTSYVNAGLNLSYTCPSGWTITSIDTGVGYAFLTVTKPGYYNIGISAFIWSSETVANYYNFVTSHSNIKICYRATNGFMPGVYNIFDTTYASTAITTTNSKIKYSTSSTSAVYTNVGVTCSENLGVYQHEIYYYLPATEFTNNDTEYAKNWINLSFNDYSTPTLPKAFVSAAPARMMTVKGGVVSITATEHQNIKLDLYNVLGCRVAKVFSGDAMQQNTFDLNGTMPSNQVYFVKLKSEKGIETEKIVPLK